MKRLISPESTIFVAGGKGMVGSAIVRALQEKGYDHILAPSRAELDLTEQKQVREFLRENQPDAVVCAAAKVGGIWANMTYPADFLYDNLIIECNLIHESHLAGIDRLLFLGSTCIYPKFSPQPIREESLLSGYLEPTNEAYALAKIAGIKLCAFYFKQYGRSYISAMPTNLYGRGDNYHKENSHVIPALIRRFHEAKEGGLPEVKIWGSGTVKREFLYVDDLADAAIFLLEHYNDPMHINIGSSEETTILALAEKIAEVVGYAGTVTTDPTKPDGMARKKTDLSRITALGWKATTPLHTGLHNAYHHFLGELGALREV